MRKSTPIAICAVLLLVALTVPNPVRATTEAGAVKHIETLGNEAFTLLRNNGMPLAQREQAFGKILREGFDLHLIGRFVLGKYWRQASEEERQDYLDAFGDYVVKVYAHRLGGFEGQSFSVTGTKIAGEKKDVMVSTRIDQKSGAPIQAAWRVRETNGQHKIIDVSVEGVSMAVTQRQEFASVVRRSGIDGLVQVLRAQTERLSAAPG